MSFRLNFTPVTQARIENEKDYKTQTSGVKIPKQIEDTFELSTANNKTFKPLSDKEILNIKPSEFVKLLQSRTDIPEELKARLEGVPENDYCNNNKIKTPEELALYDDINSLMKKNNIKPKERNEIIKNFLSMSDAKSAREVINKLVPKGYDIEFLSNLPIDEMNKDIVETVISNKKLIGSIVDTKIKKIENPEEKLEKIKNDIKNCSDEEILYDLNNDKKELEEYLDGTTYKKYEQETAKDILRHTDKRTVKYLNEYYETTKDRNFSGLMYWDKDTAKIYNKYLDKDKRNVTTLDRLYRNHHNLESVHKIFGDEKINDCTALLLEFKNYEKYKNINLDNFRTLSNENKKEFIGNFVKAFNPTLFYRAKNWDMNELNQKMKIFSNIDMSSKENFCKSYYETLKHLLDEIPQSERKPLTSKVNWIIHKEDYRKKNPIPALSDDITNLPYKTEILNGKEYKITEISKDSELSSTMHCMPSPDSIMNVEILSFTDPESFLCVGQRGKDKPFAKGGQNSENYALFTRPRIGNDLWFQSYTDVDSGTGAQRNLYTVNMLMRSTSKNCHCQRGFSYIPELIKKELDLSQAEYTKRIEKIKNCTTLDEIGKIDPQMEKTIRTVLKNNKMYEGFVRPEIMGIKLPENTELKDVNPNIISYLDSHENCRLVKIV